jgi:hypothetical protein
MRMDRLRLLAAAMFAASLICAAGSEVAAATLIVIDKPSQTMTVTVNGEVQYRWRVSTGATGFSTPTGTYTPFRMEVMHYSQEWDNAGMPHTIFFTSRGHGIHGSDHPGLGTPRSHGCVRLTLTNATTLFHLVEAQGMGNTKVIVKGEDPPGHWEASVAPQLQTGSRTKRQLFPFRIFGGSR